jgi:hypothetical protein
MNGHDCGGTSKAIRRWRIPCDVVKDAWQIEWASRHALDHQWTIRQIAAKDGLDFKTHWTFWGASITTTTTTTVVSTWPHFRSGECHQPQHGSTTKDTVLREGQRPCLQHQPSECWRWDLRTSSATLSHSVCFMSPFLRPSILIAVRRILWQDLLSFSDLGSHNPCVMARSLWDVFQGVLRKFEDKLVRNSQFCRSVAIWLQRMDGVC